MGSTLSGIGKIVGGGAIMGPLGTAAGALGGGLKDMGINLGPAEADMGGMNAAQAQAMAAARGQQTTLDALSPQQAQFGKQLADSALGKGPSLAEAQMRSTQDRGIAQQLAMAKSNRGANAGLQSRNLANQGLQGNQQLAQAAAMAKMQEQTNNQNAFSGYLNQQQGYHANLLAGSTQAAGNQYAADAANAQNKNAFVGNLIGTGASMAMMFSDRNLKTNIKPVKMAEGGKVMPQMGAKIPTIAIDPKDMLGSYIRQAGAAGANIGSFGGALSAFGGQRPSEAANSAVLDSNILQQQVNPMQQMQQIPVPGQSPQMPMMAANGGRVPGQARVAGDSEANDTVHTLLSPDEVVVPRTVAQAGPEVSGKFVAEASSNPQFDSRKFLDSLQAYSYEYKKGKGLPEGTKTSVMAQDLEKTPEGSKMVVDTPQGKAVNYAEGYGTMLAAQADLNKRLADIETKYNKPKKAKV